MTFSNVRSIILKDVFYGKSLMEDSPDDKINILGGASWKYYIQIFYL